MSHTEDLKELLHMVDDLQYSLDVIRSKVIVCLNGDVPPKGGYVATLKDVKNKDNHVLFFNYTVSEGEYEGKSLSRVCTLNQYGISELLDIYKIALDAKSYSAIALAYDKTKDLSILLDSLKDLYGLTFKVLWTPKEGFEGFTKLKVLQLEDNG